MKEPREWDEEYVLSLPLGEHNWVEMKGRRTVDLTVSGVLESKVRDDLSKAISALANSGGGVLVLGLKELPNGWAVDDGGVALSIKGRMSTREWLEDVIPNLVEESLINFNVYVITRGSENSQIEEGRGVLVVEVGDSEQAPHQAGDNKYYARVGGKSRPIGHRLVTDIFNRRRNAKMELGVSFHVVRQRKASFRQILDISPLPIGFTTDQVGQPQIEEVLEISFRAKNVGRVLVNYMNCTVWIPKAFVFSYLAEDMKTEEVEGTEYVVWTADNIERDVMKTGVGVGSTEYGPSWYRRILPSMTHHWEWGTGILRADLLRAYADDFIRWEIVVDNAPTDVGKVRIGDVPTTHEDKTGRRS